MKLFLYLLPAALMLAFAANPVSSQTPAGQNVLELEEGSSSPPATLDDIAWLAGSWQGEAFGGTFEEVWTPPSNGSMAGLYKLVHNGRVSVYEIQTITVEEGSLVWRVKHFTGDFVAWEDKEESVKFRLVKIEPEAAYFEGLTVRKEGENLIGFLVASQDGKVTEERLVYRPAPLR